MSLAGSPLKDAEFAAPGEIAAHQRALWPNQLKYVRGRSDFYRRHFDGLKIETALEALPALPFTGKEGLRDDQAANPPFGSTLTCDPDAIMRIHRTSGTTGVAMTAVLTALDADVTAEVGARAQRAAGVGPGHRVIHCLNYQLWMGGFTDHCILERAGATVVPFGVGNTARLIDTIRQLSVTAIHSTPSYPAVIEQVLAERYKGLKPRDLGLKLGLFGGEPGLDDPELRARLEDTWGFKVRNANYGMSDVFCNFAAQCEHTSDLHFMGADVMYAELIDPDSGDARPITEGGSGELVLTHLLREAQPLIRFRTGDIISVTATDTCACGRTCPRFRVIGRADDMVVVRGINVFPSMVAAVVNRAPGLNGEYRIVLDTPPPYDRLTLEAERAGESELDAQAVEQIIKRDLGVTAEVTLVAPESLGRTEGKTRRVIRNY